MPNKINLISYNNYKKIILPILIIIVVLFIPKVVTSGYTIHIMIMALIYSTLAISLNLVSGYMGALSIGHAAFYGIGAYTSAILAKNFGIPFFASIFFAIVVSAFFGLFLAIPSLKLRSSYLVITTIAFGNIVNIIMVNAMWLTRGPLGIMGIPNPAFNFLGFDVDISSRNQYYYFILFLLFIVMFFYYHLINSKTGRAIISIKEDEIAAEVLGINVVYYKVITFVISTGIAGLAGALYAHYICFISPETFSMTTSVEILVMMIVGGAGTFYGPIIGAFIITILLEQLRFLSDFRLIIYGMTLFIVIFLMPKGIAGTIADLFKKH